MINSAFKFFKVIIGCMHTKYFRKRLAKFLCSIFLFIMLILVNNKEEFS